MSKRREILIYLRDNAVLAPTCSWLAREIGLTTKQQVGNRLETESDGTIDGIWKRICYNYNISDFTLDNLPTMWEWSDKMAAQLTTENFLALCEGKWSVVKNAEMKLFLRSLCNESSLDYCYTLALFYAKVAQYDPNRNKTSQAFIEVLRQVDAVLYSHFPEAEMVHRIAQDYCHQAETTKFVGWCLLMNFVGHVICLYTHPEHFNEIVKEQTALMPFGESSWWVEPNASAEAATLWHLCPLQENGGIYEVWKMEVSARQQVRAEQCQYQRWTFLSTYDMVRCMAMEDGKVTRYGYYFYQLEDTADQMMLHLQFNSGLSGKQQYPQPAELVRVRENSVWGEWIKRQDRDQLEDVEIYLAQVAAGIEESDYEVTDVHLTRNKCTLFLKHQEGKGLEKVELNVEDYCHLRYISVWDDVKIMRSKADGQLYAFWQDPEIRIPIKNIQTIQRL